MTTDQGVTSRWRSQSKVLAIVALTFAPKATQIEVGLLLNFGPTVEMKRRVYDNDRKGLLEWVQVSDTELAEVTENVCGAEPKV